MTATKITDLNIYQGVEIKLTVTDETIYSLF